MQCVVCQPQSPAESIGLFDDDVLAMIDLCDQGWAIFDGQAYCPEHVDNEYGESILNSLNQVYQDQGGNNAH